MNLGIIALLILVAVIAIGFAFKINVGLLAMAAAVILGYASGQYTRNQIISGYSSSLFLTLLGLTLLFGIITENGCLDQVLRRVINLFGKMQWIIPLILFAAAWVVSALAGGFAGMAFITGITISVLQSTDYNPLMLMVIGNAGAQCGRYTRLSPDGNIVVNLLMEQDIEPNLTTLTINMTIGMLILSLVAFLFFKGYKGIGRGGERVHLETEKLTGKQWITLGALVVMVVLIMGLGLDSGLVALAISTVLIVLRVVDEKTAIRSIPWSTIIMVTGVGVLMNMVIDAGGIDLLTRAIASVTNSTTVSGASCLTSGIMSWFSSTLGVVVPTLTPTVGDLVARIGGGLSEMSLLSAMLIGSSSACFSPASSVGGLIIATIAGNSKFKGSFDAEKGFATIFVFSVVMVAVNSLLALVGLYRIV